MHFNCLSQTNANSIARMASLNCAMLDKAREPVPLPKEKFLESFRSVSLSLSPSLPGAPLQDKPQGGPQTGQRKATGLVYISNQRIVFVTANSPTLPISSSPIASSTAATLSTSTTPIETLSLPFQALEGRFVQPIFHSNYFEALALPAGDGNLDDSPHTVRLDFKESGAFQFYEIYEEMKSRQATSRVAQAESLRTATLAPSR